MPIHLQAKVKEVSLAKFYFFDAGVVRSLSKQLDSEMKIEKGTLLETYILHELKTYSDYNQKRCEFHYWGTPSENEVDFIVTQGSNKFGIEVKSAKSWSSDFSKGLNVLLETKRIKKSYGVYSGTDILKKDNITIFPVNEFVKKLYLGNIF